MIGIILFLSILFVVIGFIITENNAKYILAGYNTMSNEDRKKINLKTYLSFFRRFHLFLGVSTLIISLALYYLVSEDAAGISLALYPILAYIYFIAKSANSKKGLKNKHSKTANVVLIFVLITTGILLTYGYSESELILHSNSIEINGMYGEVIMYTEVKTVSLVSELPKIRYKSNGFALGSVHKGWFKTDKEKIKLLLNSNTKPYMLIIKTNGQKIFYTSKSGSTEKEYAVLKNTL